MANDEKLREALVQHNDRLRSAMQIALRDGADTNWLAFRGQCQYTLAEYHDVVNSARASLPTPPSKADADDVERVAKALMNHERGRFNMPELEWSEFTTVDKALGLDKARAALSAIQNRDAGLREAIEPYRNHDGDLPDYDDPLRCVFESGIQYAVDLLAKTLDVTEFQYCDGTEEFDGDLAGTMFNIVLAAMPTDEHGDPMHPSDLRAALQMGGEKP